MPEFHPANAGGLRLDTNSRVSLWSPKLLAPALWLDAADLTTITSSGGAVSQWNDKSGNDRHVTQGTSTRQPTTNANTQNGLNVISFDGGDDMSVNVALDVTNLSLLLVASETTAQTGAGLVVLAPSTGSDYNSKNGLLVETGASTQHMNAAKAYQAGGGVATLTGSGVTPAGIYALTSTNADITLYGPSATATATWTATTFGSCASVVIGARFDNGAISSNKLIGRIAEIIVVTRKLSVAEVNDTATHLAAKWGLTWTTK